MKQISLTKAAFGTAALVLLFEFLPLIIWGTNSFITVHDNLDLFPPFLGLSKQYGFFNIDVPTGYVDNTSSVYFGWGGLSVMNLLYHFLPGYTAYVSMYVLSLFVGFLSMYLLLETIFKDADKYIKVLISLIYSILPTIPCWSISIAALPLVFLFFYKIYKEDSKVCMWGSFFLPFLIEFNSCALFICGFWFIAWIIVCVVDKKLNKHLLVAFIMLTIGVVFFHFKLFYMQFVLAEELNRQHFDHFNYVPPSRFLRTTFDYFTIGKHHVRTFAKYLIFPSLLLYAIYVLKVFVTGLKRSSFKQSISTMPMEMKLYLVTATIALFFSVIATLDVAYLLEPIKNIFTPLKGFNFERVYVFNRILLYLSFAAILITLSKHVNKWVICVILICQIVGTYTSTRVMYSDSLKTVLYNTVKKPSQSSLSWKEFYDTELFSRIKQDISYNGEPTIEVGYHSMILMYNGINSISGYLAYYPYKDMLKFRRLIAPELEVNEKDREYYDSWGGRRYIYNSNLPYQPTRLKHEEPITLRIDMEVFRKEFDGKFIISRAPISNAVALGVEYLGEWDSKEGVYTMYVYKTI